jgi:hypothetical protein
MGKIVRCVAGLALSVALPAYAAPRSQAARGPIADQVKAAIAGGTERFDHGLWGRLVEAAVDDRGRVDYPYFQDHRADLDRYFAALDRADLSTLRAGELEALLINAYNALTVASILDHPTATTIKDISGVWDRAKHRVGGFELTLDDIEHTLLRPFFRDPRIHFAVNCASASCAPLPRFAFDGAKLDQQLDERAKLFFTDPGHARVEGSKLMLSRYFDWYGGDFVAEGSKPRAATIPEFVALYAPEPMARRIHSGEPLDVDFIEYDWSLNASRRPRG